MMSDPDMGAWTYTYDALGNLKSQTDARGCTTTLTYDALNRLTNKTFTGSGICTQPAVTYGYDSGTNGIGQRTSMTDSTGSTTWTYDPRGRMASELKQLDGQSFFTQWTYNSADLVKTMTYPKDSSGLAGEVVTTQYHRTMAVDRLVGVDNGVSTTYVSGTAYDAAGRVDIRTLGNNLLKVDYEYFGWNEANGLGRLKYIKAGTPATPNSLLDLRYYNTSTLASYYDKVGNILFIDDYKMGSPQKLAFTYDAADRLLSASATGGTNGNYTPETFTYDTNGNLGSKTGTGMYTYHGTKKHAVVSTSNGWTFGYDANGNMTSRNIGTSYTLTYDAENRLKTVSGGGVSAQFYYDGDGNRVKSVVSGATTYYIGSYFEWAGLTSTMKRYYYAGGERIAMRSGTTLYYLFGDHLGSTSVVATSTGNLHSRQLYKAWGENRWNTGTVPTTFRYTGQRQEAGLGGASGLYDYGARFYDPALGRWIQPDTVVPNPYIPLDWDRFSYVRNNSLSYKDPSGHICTHVGNSTVCTDDDDYQFEERFDFSASLSNSGMDAFASMQQMEIELGIALTEEDWLSFVLFTEYVGTFGDNVNYNRAFARRYRENCSKGPFSAQCYNSFWGYNQATLRGELEKLKKFFASASQWTVATSRSIARAILTPHEPNKHGITSNMNSCYGYACDYGFVTPGQKLYERVNELYNNGDVAPGWMIIKDEFNQNLNLVLTVEQHKSLCQFSTQCFIAGEP